MKDCTPPSKDIGYEWVSKQVRKIIAQTKEKISKHWLKRRNNTGMCDFIYGTGMHSLQALFVVTHIYVIS